MAKLAAYAQYQASQQNQAKSKAGMLLKGSHYGLKKKNNRAALFKYCTASNCVLFLSVVPAESFDWGRYLCSNNTVGAPVSCFKHVSKETGVTAN